MAADRWIHRLLGADALRPTGPIVTRRYETIVSAPLEVAFAFFADASNLERLTPPWLRFAITTPMPVVMDAGLEIDYRIVVRGLLLPWRSRIEVWEPNVCFVDRQTLGPYRWWRHEHRFEPVAAGTRVIDQLEFVPRFSWISQSLVTRDVDRIFAYRRAQLPALVSRRS